MNNSTLKHYNRKLLAASILSSAIYGQPHAAPLPVGSVLGLDAGIGAATNTPCTSGTCFGLEVAPGLVIWTTVAPGTDGGFVVGKNQASGGQELAPSAANATSGELTAAWNFFANYGTFFTPNGISNVFSDTSCAGPSCIGVTVLNSFNYAQNTANISMGSATPCSSAYCSAEELAGEFITEYTIAGDGQPWGIHFHTVVPDGDPSSFGNVKFQFLARGVAVIPTPTPSPTPYPQPSSCCTPTPSPTPTPTPPPTPIPECDTYILNGNVYAESRIGEAIQWIPNIQTSYPTLKCWISSPPLSSFATVSDDCSTGTFTAYEAGTYTFTYDSRPIGCRFLDQGPGTVTITTTSNCEALYPQTEVTMIGKGKTLEVEETMTTTFKGHIVSTDEAKGKVTICRGSTVRYEVISTVGTANCTVKHGVSAESTGTLSDKGKLVCTNKPDGKDTDKFKIKRSKNKNLTDERRWFR